MSFQRLSKTGAAVGIFNTNSSRLAVALPLKLPGISVPAKSRDFWALRDLSAARDSVTFAVPKRGVAALRISKPVQTGLWFCLRAGEKGQPPSSRSRKASKR